MPYLPHQSDRLQPSEAFFDPLPLALAHPVSTMPRGSFIEGAATPPLRVLRPRHPRLVDRRDGDRHVYVR
jgi:hypothetical protein